MMPMTLKRRVSRSAARGRQRHERQAAGQQEQSTRSGKTNGGSGGNDGNKEARVKADSQKEPKDSVVKTSANQRRSKGAKGSTATRGYAVSRYFTRPGQHPFDQIDWEVRTAAITGEGGQVYFEQKDVEIPA